MFLITSSLHVFWSWLFIIKLDMEVAGAGISLSVTYITDYVLLSIFSLFTRRLTLSDIIGMRHCLRYWKPYLCQAIPGMVSLLVEWGALEAMTIMAGYFSGHYEITAAVILLNVYMIANQFSMSMGLTSCNLIGSVQTDARLVKKVGTIIFLYGLVAQGLISAALVFGRKFILNFYTDDTEVIEVLNQCWMLFTLYLVLVTINQTIVGAIRGFGKQKTTTVTIALIYLLIQIPAAYFFAFTADLKVFGLWLSMPIAGLVFFIFLGAFIFYSHSR